MKLKCLLDWAISLMYIIKKTEDLVWSLVEYRLEYDYNLRAFHQNQHIVDAHSDNFRIDVTLFLLSHTILICGAVVYVMVDWAISLMYIIKKPKYG